MSYFIDKDGKLKSVRTIITAIIVFVILVVIFIEFPFGTVGAGERGVQLRFDAVTGKVLNEGLYWRTPFIEDVKKMDVKIQKIETKVNAASKDLQDVFTTIAVNYHLDPDAVAVIYKEVEIGEIKVRLIDPALEESVKSATAQFTAEELITRRAEVGEAIKKALSERLKVRSIVVDAFSIVNFSFSESFSNAIERKVTAEQSALEQKNKLKEEEYKAEQIVVKAKAEAEAIRIQAQAITSQGGKDYVNLQWIAAWEAGGAQVPQIISGESSAFLYNLGDMGQ